MQHSLQIFVQTAIAKYEFTLKTTLSGLLLATYDWDIKDNGFFFIFADVFTRVILFIEDEKRVISPYGSFITWWV